MCHEYIKLSTYYNALLLHPAPPLQIRLPGVYVLLFSLHLETSLSQQKAVAAQVREELAIVPPYRLLCISTGAV